jgi:putative chitinase
MPLHLQESDWRAIFPRAPQAIIDAFVADSASLDRVGITHSRARLAYALANVEHECGSFSIPNLTENINCESARIPRAAEVAACGVRKMSASGSPPSNSDDLFFESLIRGYVNENPRFVRRDWLAKELGDKLQEPGKHFVLLIATQPDDAELLEEIAKEAGPVAFGDVPVPLAQIGPDAAIPA